MTDHNETDQSVQAELGDEVILRRRIEDRIDALEKNDRPFLRKTIGWIVIIASVLIGWSMLNQRAERLRSTVTQRSGEDQAAALIAESRSQVESCFRADEIAWLNQALKDRAIAQPAERSALVRIQSLFTKMGEGELLDTPVEAEATATGTGTQDSADETKANELPQQDSFAFELISPLYRTAKLQEKTEFQNAERVRFEGHQHQGKILRLKVTRFAGSDRARTLSAVTCTEASALTCTCVSSP